jgi:hypothetical protein
MTEYGSLLCNKIELNETNYGWFVVILSRKVFDLPVCINMCNLTLSKAFTGTSQKYYATLELNSGSIIVIDIPHHAKVPWREKSDASVRRKVLACRQNENFHFCHLMSRSTVTLLFLAGLPICLGRLIQEELSTWRWRDDSFTRYVDSHV